MLTKYIDKIWWRHLSSLTTTKGRKILEGIFNLATSSKNRMKSLRFYFRLKHLGIDSDLCVFWGWGQIENTLEDFPTFIGYRIFVISKEKKNASIQQEPWHLNIRVIQKRRGQDEVGRWSINDLILFRFSMKNLHAEVGQKRAILST
jgi:hypothetical protein